MAATITPPTSPTTDEQILQRLPLRPPTGERKTPFDLVCCHQTGHTFIEWYHTSISSRADSPGNSAKVALCPDCAMQYRMKCIDVWLKDRDFAQVMSLMDQIGEKVRHFLPGHVITVKEDTH